MTPPLVISEDLVDRLRHARSVVALTGAGISAESGIPTFRDALSGLWSRYRPEDLATPEAFRRNPRLVWEWYAARRVLVREAAPNPGHHALAAMERRIADFTLVTQNVDGLHQRAGSRRILEVHGNILRTRCSAEGRLVDEATGSNDVPPRCPRCGAPLRPDVVWFGEALPAAVFEAALAAAEAAEVLLSVGTSSVVYPAASLVDVALAKGAWVVEVNPQATAQSPRVTHRLVGPSGVILPALVAAVWPE